MHNAVINALDQRPKNMGPMRAASAHARITGPCGDTLEVWLRIDGGRIRRGTFVSDGCAASVHCCSIAVKMAEGLTPAEAIALKPEPVLEAAGNIPEDHAHCALLAVNTIRAALNTYQQTGPLPPHRSLFGFWRKK